MNKLETDIGKIYCSYNNDKDDFDMIRLIKVDKDSKKFICKTLNENYKYDSDKEFSEEEFSDIKKNWTALKSDGVVTITNINVMDFRERTIKDVIGVFWANNPTTKVPEVYNPYAVSRQGVTNLFAQMAGCLDQVGLSVTVKTVPADYALTDFMVNDSIISSTMSNVYKIDDEKMLSEILDNEDTSNILKDLYEHREYFLENTRENFKKDEEHKPLDGYCYNLKDFFTETGFIEDIREGLGIAKVDFEMEYSKPLSEEDKLVTSVLFGGIRIEKAIPMKFDYSIDMRGIKMKYVLLADKNDVLWIVPYTESKNEVDEGAIYNLTEERTKVIQERLRQCVKTYTESLEK